MTKKKTMTKETLSKKLVAIQHDSIKWAVTKNAKHAEAAAKRIDKNRNDIIAAFEALKEATPIK